MCPSLARRANQKRWAVRVVPGGRTDRLVPGIVVLLAGLAVGMQSWPVILSLGAIVVAHTIMARRTE
jgi:hypothetical protein